MWKIFLTLLVVFAAAECASLKKKTPEPKFEIFKEPSRKPELTVTNIQLSQLTIPLKRKNIDGKTEELLIEMLSAKDLKNDAVIDGTVKRVKIGKGGRAASAEEFSMAEDDDEEAAPSGVEKLRDSVRAFMAKESEEKEHVGEDSSQEEFRMAEDDDEEAAPSGVEKLRDSPRAFMAKESDEKEHVGEDSSQEEFRMADDDDEEAAPSGTKQLHDSLRAFMIKESEEKEHVREDSSQEEHWFALNETTTKRPFIARLNRVDDDKEAAKRDADNLRDALIAFMSEESDEKEYAREASSQQEFALNKTTTLHPFIAHLYTDLAERMARLTTEKTSTSTKLE